jgi:hypothetical protein
MDDLDAQEILTADDTRFLAGCTEFGKVLTNLKQELARARVEADGVKPDGLLFLQGRIATLKSFINLFEDVI